MSTKTASPGQLVVMLFDGAIRFLERAMTGFDHEDPLERNLAINNNIQRTRDIIAELDASLDLARGGELATTLHRLYDYLDRRLSESNLHKTPEGIRESIDRLTVLRDAWRQMLTQQGVMPGMGCPAPAYGSASLSACV